MGRIAEAFERARREDRAALVIYVCAGDPDLSATERVVVAAAEAGADVIELGMPFSDPTADGPTIQRASQRALSGGTTLSKVLETVRAIRKQQDVPIMLFGYYNPILVYGEERLVVDAAAAGVDGFLVVDLPPEESTSLRGPIVENGLDFVPLIAPTSDPERIALAADAATSFVYYVSMTGVTGAELTDLTAATDRAATLQRDIEKPIAIGFGIRTREDVRRVAAGVDGVVVGSAVVRAIEQAPDVGSAVSAVRELVSDLAAGLRRSG